MTTFAVVDNNQLLDSVNYLLSNLNQSDTGNANVIIPGNVLTANATTGIVQPYGSNILPPTWFSFQWINLRYATNATGTQNFSSSPTNALYFGIYNSTTATPSANPAAYTWTEVAGGFGTTKTIYYSSIGGRRAQWVAAASAPSADFLASTPNVAINLDIVTTAAGTPGTRGPIAMAYVITPSDPTVATSSTLTTWFEAPRTNVVAPIGTGLAPPVTGDTASFTWAAGPGSPTVTYSYNGSIWVPVTGQVISGNVIITGTLAGNAIIAGTITGDRIAANTITGNTIQLSAITGNLIANTTITGDKIVTGTITANNIAANTITANNIAVATITSAQIAANTIQGNNIAAGTITANNLAANTLTANTVVSTGATLGSNTSQGFWLQGNTGNARFGNSVSIGNQLTVGEAARFGNSVVIGNNLTIGNILTIGNSAVIGGNLAVSGLITAGNLISNTVATLTMQPNSVSSTSAAQNYSGRIATNATAGQYYVLTPTVTVDVPTPGATLTVQWSGSITVQWSVGAANVIITWALFRSVGGGAFSLQNSTSTQGSPYTFTSSNGFTYVDTNNATYGTGVTYRYYVAVRADAATGSFSFLNIDRLNSSIFAQNLKR